MAKKRKQKKQSFSEYLKAVERRGGKVKHVWHHFPDSPITITETNKDTGETQGWKAFGQPMVWDEYPDGSIHKVNLFETDDKKREKKGK